MTTSSPNEHLLDDLDRFLINAAIKIGRVADDIGGALLILAFYADEDGSGITPTELMSAWHCLPSKYMEGIAMLDRAGVPVPAGWRLC
jgi:hypothetical protein